MCQGGLNDCRSELYSGLVDAVHAGDHLENVGQVILPSSYIGGSRHMFQLYQDSIALGRAFGRPDLFFTITADPNAPEIKDSLLPGQTAQDRPDLVARVFQEKAHKILKAIDDGFFGKCRGHVYTIEFQKR